MKINAQTSLVNVARAVCTALDEVGITAVLTGGSAATYYAPAAYQSADIDFVAVRFKTLAADNAADSAMLAIGFQRKRDHYRHAASPYPVEFPPGPLAVGGELLEDWRTDSVDHTVLHVLSPTDSCKDRLAAFLHWNDRPGLAQALAVARTTGDQIDFHDLERWFTAEGAEDKYAEFLRRLRQAE